MDSEVTADRFAQQRARGEMVRRIWKAPAEHGSAVIDPPWSVLPQVVHANQQLWSQVSPTAPEFDWPGWQRRCREACLKAAVEYTSRQLGFSVPGRLDGPLIVVGHQPELFHPGVWAKNFATFRLAERVQGVALNLIIDSDASATATLSVPVGIREHPYRHQIAFDAPRPLQPWETARIQEPAVFAGFGTAVQEAMRPWDVQPIISDVWPAAVQRGQNCGSLVDGLTAARVSAERRWGVENLEVPISQLCQTSAFHEFVALLLLQLPVFHEHHNQVLQEFRKLNRIRSRSHPVPELVRDGEWYEAPFWIWRDAATQRDRLFARRESGTIHLRDRHGEFLRAPVDAVSLTDALGQLAQQRIHLRTRALTTTLFARLGLADLFVHGLGGAKYDEMTDALMTRVFGRIPPSFLTVSATFHLPLPVRASWSAQQRGDVRHRLRDLECNPQRHLTHPSIEAERLIQERNELLLTLHGTHSTPSALTRHDRRKCYVRLLEIREQLQSFLLPQHSSLEAALRHDDHLQRTRQILASREYSWVLFPAERIQSVMTSLFPT